MTTFKNESGSKEVNISKSNDGIYRCFYIQVYTDDQRHEQVLDSKDYKSFKMAEKWAKKQLS